MKRYRIGNPAPYGLYFSGRPLDVRFVGADGEALEGLPDASYRRMPTLVAIAAGPVLGGIFVMLFPLLIIGATLAGLFRLAFGGARKAAEEHAWIASPRYQPGAAFLSKGEGAEEEEKADEDLESLKAEADARREDR